jgi:hypothetical protein
VSVGEDHDSAEMDMDLEILPARELGSVPVTKRENYPREDDNCFGVHRYNQKH